MAGASGLALVLMALLMAVVLIGGTVGLLGYGLLAKDARKGLKASVVGLVLSCVSVLLSSPVWMVVLSGRDTHGEPLNWSESGPLVAVVVVEAAVLLVSVLSTLRQWRRVRAAT
jgi:hypothetical protein